MSIRPNEDRARKRVCELDLGALERRLLRRSVLPAERVPAAVAAYRDFLELKVALKDEDATTLSPPLPVDRVWHEHILDTRAYARDCASLLGAPKLLHHDADGDADRAARAKRIEATAMCYTARFCKAPEGWAWSFDDAGETLKGEEVKVEPAAAESVKAFVRVCDLDGSSVRYEALKSTPLARLMAAHCARLGINPAHVRFLHNGHRVSPVQTLDHLGEADKKHRATGLPIYMFDATLEQEGC